MSLPYLFDFFVCVSRLFWFNSFNCRRRPRWMLLYTILQTKRRRQFTHASNTTTNTFCALYSKVAVSFLKQPILYWQSLGPLLKAFFSWLSLVHQSEIHSGVRLTIDISVLTSLAKLDISVELYHHVKVLTFPRNFSSKTKSFIFVSYLLTYLGQGGKICETTSWK